MKTKLKQYLFVAFGVLLMDIGYYYFYNPVNLVAGGVTGLSIIFKPLLENIGMSQSTFLYIIEAICLLLGLVLIGKDFFFKTILASVLSPTFVLLFETISSQDLIINTVENKLLIAFICGASLQGIGIGICLRNNGSTGGLDVIQKAISKYSKVPYSIAMYLTDWVIVILSGLSYSIPLTYDFEIVLFGFLSVALAAYIIDMITLNARSRRTAYIITNKPDLVKAYIFEHIGRGCTESLVKGSYTNEDKTMIICVLNKNESYKLREDLKEIDEDAFTFFTSTREVIGEYANKPKNN